MQIQLTKSKWSYDPGSSLGPPGSFGEVFSGTSEQGEVVAIKRLKESRESMSHRELKIAKELSDRSFEHVIPVFDFGYDQGTSAYYIVMAKADKDLKSFIENRNISQIEAAIILLDVATGLQEANAVVHRDVKPANILFHDNRWKLADFGIARFSEDSTSDNTLKGFKSRPYAAPEQWNSEHSTNAADIYALGCVGYELISGRPPFPGPSSADYRHQHINEAAGPLSTSDPRLSSLISMMLKKAAVTRPSIERVISILKTIATNLGPLSESQKILANAGAAISLHEAHTDARRQLQETTLGRRALIACEAYKELQKIGESLCNEVIRLAPNAERRTVSKRIKAQTYKVTLGSASISLEMETNHVHAIEEFERSKWDVIASAAIGVYQSNPQYEWWSSLWFTNLGVDTQEFRWYEIAYYTTPVCRTRPAFEPFQLSHDPSKADEASSSVLGVTSVAFGPVPIDDENQVDFFSRWFNLFGRAAEGKLTRPTQFPITTFDRF